MASFILWTGLWSTGITVDKGPQVLFSKYFHEHSLNLTHPAAPSMPQEPRQWELLCGAQHCPGVSLGSSSAEGRMAQGGESGEQAFLPGSLATPKEGGSLPQPWSRQWALALVRQLFQCPSVFWTQQSQKLPFLFWIAVAIGNSSNSHPLLRGHGHPGLSIPATECDARKSGHNILCPHAAPKCARP